MGRKHALSLTKAAALIEERLKVPCTPQALNYHLKRGRLPECVRDRNPWKIDPDLLLEEYAATISKKRVGRKLNPDGTVGHYTDPVRDAAAAANSALPEPPQPLSERPRTVSAGFIAEDGTIALPNLLSSINAAKAWAELEKARKLQIERLALESEYVRKSDVKPTWEKAFLAVSRGVMGIASKIKSDHPDADFSIIEDIRAECRAALVKVFDEMMQLEPEPDQPTAEEKVFQLPDSGDMEFSN
jgi:hypothetical protein